MSKKLHMIKNDYNQWSKFKGVKNNTITQSELRLIEHLHAKYYDHPLETLCTCRGETMKGKIQQYVDDLNIIYNNGSE
jgi:hypothetical protein|tara:strand:- start:4436 stop:4669 length:234 start_codon:yes stop_codon:yes gene_type:complete